MTGAGSDRSRAAARAGPDDAHGAAARNDDANGRRRVPDKRARRKWASPREGICLAQGPDVLAEGFWEPL